MAERHEIGGNNPPDQTVTAAETMRDISDFLSENPLIDEAHAREAKLFIDRGKLAIADLEAERETKVKPLNQQVQQINDHYRSPRELLKKVLNEIQERLSSFLRAEETKRQAAAAEARRIAEAAEQAAREAERIERERLADAAVGEAGIDVAALTIEADTKFREMEKAQRQAAIAERDAKIKIGGGFGRALGLKTKEELIIIDAIDAIHAIGVTESITEAILTSARAYRKLNGVLPKGVISETERKV
jgi:hypothetical protein